MNEVETAQRRVLALQRVHEVGILPRPDLAAVEGERAARSRRRARLLTAAVWLIAAYPLGVGPAAYALERGWLRPAAVTIVYAPLIGLGEAVTPIGEMLEWYSRPFAAAGRRATGR